MSHLWPLGWGLETLALVNRPVVLECFSPGHPSNDNLSKTTRSEVINPEAMSQQEVTWNKVTSLKCQSSSMSTPKSVPFFSMRHTPRTAVWVSRSKLVAPSFNEVELHTEMNELHPKMKLRLSLWKPLHRLYPLTEVFNQCAANAGQVCQGGSFTGILRM